jgi:negative regulator of flagellin synthesis FlgM
MSFGNNISDVKQAMTPVRSTSEAEPSRIRTAGSTEQPASISLAQPDEAKLSSTGGLIAQALGGSDVRTAKIEALQKTIVEGRYNVPSSEVAGKIIQSMTE